MAASWRQSAISDLSGPDNCNAHGQSQAPAPPFFGFSLNQVVSLDCQVSLAYTLESKEIPPDGRLDFLHLYQMTYFGNHSANLGSVIVNHALVHSPYSQSTNGQFLLFLAPNSAFFLCDL